MVDLKQNGIYGIGVFSKYLTYNAFKTLESKIFDAFEHVISTPEANSEENICATENAYIALGLFSFY
jgi:hypothetical protein